MKALLDQKLQNLFDQNIIAGMSVAVTNRKEVIYQKGFGVECTERPNVPTYPDALYRVASVTKLVTGFSILKLCAEGKLSLDLPITNYVPWLHLEDNAENRITLRHLLSHTAGFPVEYTPDGPREESALEDSLKQELANVKLLSSPEEKKHLYSNLGIRLASYIAEQAAGMPYTQIAQKYVLDPLGMTHSTYDLRVAATYPLSLPHDIIDGKLVPQHYIKENAARMAAGGLYSNVSDLSKLARCILNDAVSDSGEQIIPKELFFEMLKPHSNRSSQNDYGLTMMGFHFGDKTVYGHTGSAVPYGSCLAADRENGLGVIVLMNTFVGPLRTEIPRMILSEIK